MEEEAGIQEGGNCQFKTSHCLSAGDPLTQALMDAVQVVFAFRVRDGG